MKSFLAIMIFVISQSGIAQDTGRFEGEIATILDRYDDGKPESPVIFTGSSSIRFWTEVTNLRSDRLIVNHGFGGSEASDLLFYLKQLVLDFEPSQVFIYEGDNDIASGKNIDSIRRDFVAIIDVIGKSVPNAGIVLISAKPSPSRWEFQSQYQALNSELRKLAESRSNVVFADVWTPMLESNGEVKKDIFLDDMLHMNEDGYQIWTKVLQPYLD